MSIKGDRFGIPDFQKFDLKIFLLLFELAVLKKCLVSGVYHQQAVEPIEQDIIAGNDIFTGVLQTNHRRNAQGPGHDGGVGGFASNIGGKTLC